MRNHDNLPGDNTTRNHTYYVSPTAIAYSATIALTPEAVNVGIYKFADLTGALTVNATVTNLVEDDLVELRFAADGTARVVTLGNNIKSAGTLSLAANDEGTWVGRFDGTNIVEVSRALTA